MKFYKNEKGMEQMKNERIEKLQESWELDERWKGSHVHIRQKM